MAAARGIAVVWWCVGVLCLRNPFRESAERGTQTSEWGKNSVSLPVLHPPPRSIPPPPSPDPCAHYHYLSLFLRSGYVSLGSHPFPALPVYRSFGSLGYAATKPNINSADVSWQVIFTKHETSREKR